MLIEYDDVQCVAQYALQCAGSHKERGSGAASDARTNVLRRLSHPGGRRHPVTALPLCARGKRVQRLPERPTVGGTSSLLTQGVSLISIVPGAQGTPRLVAKPLECLSCLNAYRYTEGYSLRWR